MVRKLVVMSFCVLIIIAISGCNKQNSDTTSKKLTMVKIEADFPEFLTIEELTMKADLIIKGTVLSARVEELNVLLSSDSNSDENQNSNEKAVSKNVYTIYTVMIDDCYKGSLPVKNTIEVKVLGGTINNINYVYQDIEKLESNKGYIMFLATFKNSPASLLNPIQALYIDKVNESENFDNISTKNKLKLSTNYLEKLMQNKTNKNDFTD